jgi:hypothetical protein
MSEIANARSAAEAIAGNPKFATAVAASTASMGAASQLEILQGVLAIVSLSVGILTALVVLAIQTIKLVRVWRAWQADQPETAE